MVLDSKKCSSIINFSKARLVLVNKTSSYVELSAPDLNNNKCLFCSKSTNHDHDIIGKVKFDPKQKSYLVSLLEKKSQTSLDVIPIKNNCHDKDTQEEPSR